MKKLKNKFLINSICALVASATIVAPLCSFASKTIISNNQNAKDVKLTSASNAQYTTVSFSAGDKYAGKCTITGSTLVKARVGLPFCSITQPKILHNDSWKFKGWSKNGTDPIDANEVILAEGLKLTPLFEEPVDITNCMGVSAIEETDVTVTLQTTDAPDLNYSDDYGKNWKPVTSSVIHMEAGTTIYFRGQNDGTKKEKTLAAFSTSPTNYTHFSFSDHVNIFGNVLALIYNGTKVTNLSKVPNNYCFYHLFEGCDQIMNISDNFLMSEGNEDPGTEQKPKEIVTDCLKAHCYDGMFKGCINISHAPRLYATNANVKNAQGCYVEIFSGCTKLNYIRTRFTGDFAHDDYKACWTNWLENVATKGTIVYDGTNTEHSASGIPSQWEISRTPDEVKITTTSLNFTADHEYQLEGMCYKAGGELPDEKIIWISENPEVAVVDQATGVLKGIPFDPTNGTSKTAKIKAYSKSNLNANAEVTVTINTFDSNALKNCTKITATEAATFHWTYVGDPLDDKGTLPTFRYSFDGITWKNMIKDTDVSIAANSSIYIKGNNETLGLARGDDETSHTNFKTTSGKIKVDGDIKGLIYDGRGSTEITDAKIPCNYCFKSLFENSNVTSVSSGFLSFTNFNGKTNVYQSMFEECQYLTTAPDLPATTLTDYCYFRMFFNCSKLAAAPALNSETLAHSCYKRMFYGCTTITSTPTLPATTAQPYCYYMMFQNCSSLTSIGKISITVPDAYSCFQMFASISYSLWNKITHQTQSKTNYIFRFTNISAENCVLRMITYENGSGGAVQKTIYTNEYYYIS